MGRSGKLLVSLAWLALLEALRFAYALAGRRPGSAVILYYHAVRPEQRGRFARQLDDLLRLGRPIAAGFAGLAPRGGHHIAVTFDDGFRSVVENGLPELRSRGIACTLFVPAGRLGGHPDWEMEEGCADLSEVILRADELRAVRSDLVAIGSHGVAHARLTGLSPSQLAFELEESRRILEELLREPVPLFSYPYGDYDGPVVATTRAAGYARAFTIEPRAAFREPGEFLTGRVPTDPSDWRLEWCLKMRGAYSWLPLASALLRWWRGLPSSPRRDARWRTLE